MNYQQFLEKKSFTDRPSGLDIVPELGKHLFNFQRDIVNWALRRGRSAIFADCGVDTNKMLEYKYATVKKEDKKNMRGMRSGISKASLPTYPRSRQILLKRVSRDVKTSWPIHQLRVLRYFFLSQIWGTVPRKEEDAVLQPQVLYRLARNNDEKRHLSENREESYAQDYRRGHPRAQVESARSNPPYRREQAQLPSVKPGTIAISIIPCESSSRQGIR